MDKDQQAALLVTLAERAQMTWAEIARCPKHGLGYEFLVKSSVKCGIPKAFGDRDKFMVFRYYGKLPIMGVRTGDTFHVIWIATNFGQLYRH